MLTTSVATQNAWASGGYVGGNKPGCRVTVQKLHVASKDYNLSGVVGLDLKGKGTFSSIYWGQTHTPVELPNLKSVKWERNVEQDVATCVIELYNTAPLPLGATPAEDHDWEQPGFYSPGRGTAGNRWGYTDNKWGNLLRPNRLIRTYQGYGANYAVAPEADTNLYPSGVWLIDRVIMSPTGLTLTLECRDIGRVLLEQICLPPVVPWNQYPVFWEYALDRNKDGVLDDDDPDWFTPTYSSDSNKKYVGEGVTDAGVAVINADGSVLGHDGKDAFDASDGSYWLSVGEKPSDDDSYPWIEGKFGMSVVSGVKVLVEGGPYTVFVSVWDGTSWKGRAKVPYVAGEVDMDSDIRFVKKFTAAANDLTIIKLPQAYQDITKVRLTFTDLWNSGAGTNRKYRAAVKKMRVLAKADAVEGPGSGTVKDGNYLDYTDIVKWFAAWSGFYWFRDNDMGFQTWSDGTKQYYSSSDNDPVFPSDRGQVWGDLEQTGTYGPATLTVDIFDKKPIMDCINYVREIVGFNFYIDEYGGVIFRSPNIWSIGNYVTPATGPGQAGTYSNATLPHTGTPIVIDENTTLMDLTSTLDGTNLRERVFIANTTGKIGAVAPGYNPLYPENTGLRRVGGWTDQGFKTKAEARKMADLITIRQIMSYRTDAITIPGNPAIQIDDQVRIYERVTADSYYHYVKGIASEWEAETGKWTYALQTCWLGATPFTDWIFDPNDLSDETKAYLTAIGKI
jgi:hypothetical protein